MGSPLDTLGRNRILQVLVYVLAWTALGTISASQSVISYALAGDEPPVLLIFKLTLPSWYVWAALAPLIFLAARRFPVDGARWAAHLPLHLGLNLIMLFVSGGIVIGVVTIKSATSHAGGLKQVPPWNSPSSGFAASRAA